MEGIAGVPYDEALSSYGERRSARMTMAALFVGTGALMILRFAVGPALPRPPGAEPPDRHLQDPAAPGCLGHQGPLFALTWVLHRGPKTRLGPCRRNRLFGDEPSQP
jgi:hypothetical protein